VWVFYVSVREKEFEKEIGRKSRRVNVSLGLKFNGIAACYICNGVL